MSKLIAGNWKMNGTRAEAEALCDALLAGFRPDRGAEMIVAPPFTCLDLVGRRLAGSAIALAGQDCAAEPPGAHTGDVAAMMLADLGARHVILGHSERRHGRGETDAMVRAKFAAARAAGLAVILCVGETGAEREAGEAESTVARQLDLSLPEEAGAQGWTIAYEPVWAIGTGKTASNADVQAMHGFIQQQRPGVAVLYGGSVKPENAGDILALPGVDGVLVGGASLKAESFLAIAAAVPGV